MLMGEFAHDRIHVSPSLFLTAIVSEWGRGEGGKLQQF